MTVDILKISDGILSLDSLFEYCEDRRIKSPHYNKVDNDLVYTAYIKAKAQNLRYDRKRNIMRDDRLGVLSRPSNPSEWQEASFHEALTYLMRHLWAKAVREYNIKKGV